MTKMIETTKLSDTTTSSRIEVGRLVVDQALSERYEQYRTLLKQAEEKPASKDSKSE